ncbi:uncharacterized protein LOC121864476 [Homarus americanus]|uniref:Uncharacterized protein n=1 Tax=Homarus americanus TaxID=6706 RepID=A0A8J5TUE0_HOMAM|nr:uncharacterized protein LOC121864476 [Homarus americanus]KAG7177408.1 hypothetical protein Hamer_G016698 [Homarus americanus]
MPPLKPIVTLKTLCTEAMAATLAAAFVRVVGGGLCGAAKRLVGRSKNTRTTKRPVTRLTDGILASHPGTLVLKIQQYIGHGLPKDRRQDLMHQVLFLVTEMMTRLGRTKKNKDSSFGVTVQKLGQALSYALDTLLDPVVTKLDLTPLIHHSIKWVSTCKLNNRNPKETNEIDTVKVENMLIKIFGQNAQKLDNLTSIQWPHLVSGEVIRIIGRHCKSLRRLELACECDATAAMNDVKEDPAFARQERLLMNSLGALYDRAPGDFSGNKPGGCPHLQTLVLPRLDDEDGSLATHVASALCSLRELEVISGAPMLVSLGKLKNQQYPPQKLFLKHLSDIDTYNRRPMPDLSYLKGLLPQLNSIELIASQGITRPVTESFLNVKSLKIAQTDFHLNVRRFKYLETLDINLEFQIAWPLLFSLSRSRVQLRDLTLRHPTFQVGQEHEGSSLRLPSLQSFTLVRSSFIEYNAFRNLVMGAPNLVNISITLSDDRNYTVDEFRDDLISSVATLLPNLESFTAECQYKHNLYNQLNCVLTIDSANILCANCPRLKFLGHLDAWDLDDKDVNDLNDRVKANNWDLQVV